MALAEVTPAYCESLWQEVNNWQRWGDKDQKGALNLITKEKIAEAAALVKTGVTIGVGNPWPVDPSPHNPWPAEHRMIRAGDDCDYPGVPGLSVALDYIGVQHHGISCSHIDALCHVFVDHKMYNGYPAADVKSTGATRNDVSPMKDGIVSRGILLDIPAAKQLPYLPGEYRISVKDLEEAQARQQLTVTPGDILIIHKGKQQRIAKEGYFDPVEKGMPGLHPECVRWLHEHGVAILGSDYMNDPQPNWDCESWPIPVHYLGICGMGMTLMHSLDTMALADYCAEINRWAFQLIISPLFIPGATGSPVNPVAVF